MAEVVEALGQEVFRSLREAQVLIEPWRRCYDPVRPHSALHPRPPAPGAAPWPAPAGTPLRPAAGRDTDVVYHQRYLDRSGGQVTSWRLVSLLTVNALAAADHVLMLVRCCR